MKTAIEKIKEAYPKWCFYTEQGEKVIHADVLESLINEGLEMEMQQLVDACEAGWSAGADDNPFPDYYTQTFTKR